MAWTTEEKGMFKRLFDQVQGIVLDISKLFDAIAKCCTNDGCKCECMQQPYRIITEETIWYTDTNNEGQCSYVQKTDEQLNLNDRFPPTNCDGQKGDLLCSDGIVCCTYHIGSNGNPTGWASDRAYYIPYPTCS